MWKPAAAGNVTKASVEGASATADVVEMTPTPAGAVVAAGRAGWAIGEAASMSFFRRTFRTRLVGLYTRHWNMDGRTYVTFILGGRSSKLGLGQCHE